MTRIHPDGLEPILIDQLKNKDLLITLTDYGKKILANAIQKNSFTEYVILCGMFVRFMKAFPDRFALIGGTDNVYGIENCSFILEMHNAENYFIVPNVWWYPRCRTLGVAETLLIDGQITLKYKGVDNE